MKRYTRWIPVHYYYFDSNNYMVFARLKKNGLLYFKTKKIFGSTYHPINYEIDFHQQINFLFDLELIEIF